MNFMEKEKPIGVFDSDIGGLTVVKRLMSVLPKESIVYFGDTARVPYGSKSNETVIEYSIQNTKFLLQKGVKAVVVACNTASSIALDELKKNFDVPVIGMIMPGAQMAVENTRNKKIGVIGTRATISNKAYSKAIKEIDADIEVFEKACPLFVPLAEEGWTHHKATYEIAEEYLKELSDKEIDTLVLGCTHYPVLRKAIQSMMGDEVTLVDSAEETAKDVAMVLAERDLLRTTMTRGVYTYFVTDIPHRFMEMGTLFLGAKIEAAHLIDIM